MNYQEFVNQNRMNLDDFCFKYFRDNFNSDKALITDERFANLTDYMSKTYSEYKSTNDNKKLLLFRKLEYLQNYLDKQLTVQDYGMSEPDPQEKLWDDALDDIQIKMPLEIAKAKKFNSEKEKIN